MRRRRPHGASTQPPDEGYVKLTTMDTVHVEIERIPCLRDNYAFLLVPPGGEAAVVVDPGEAAPVLERLQQRGLPLGAVWATHHHPDHIGGIEALWDALGPFEVLGSRYDADRGRIPHQSKALNDEERFTLGSLEAIALHVPGHTLGAMSFLLESQWLFTGDTLFLGGCGRLFEGDAATMYHSLRRLAALPGDPLVHCGHEYTEANLRFALHVDPDNEALRSRLRRVRRLRAADEPTVPAPLSEERATNPFLRAEALAEPGEHPEEAFARLRALKDRWRG